MGAQPLPDDSGNIEIRLSPLLTINFPSRQQPLSPSCQFMAFPSPPSFRNNTGVWVLEQVICAKSCRVSFRTEVTFLSIRHCVDGKPLSLMCTKLSNLQRPYSPLLHKQRAGAKVIHFLCKPSNKCLLRIVTICIIFCWEKELMTLGLTLRK